MEGYPTDNGQALLDQAKQAWQRDDVHAALQLCDRTALLGPTWRYQAAILRGDILMALGDAAGALSSYESVADPAVVDGQIDAARGLALLELGQFAEAENALSSALRQMPEHVDVLIALGLIAEIHRNGHETELYRRARRLAPERFGLMPRLNQKDFETVIANALAQLPGTLQHEMKKIPVLVTDVPHREELLLYKPAASPSGFGMWLILDIHQQGIHMTQHGDQTAILLFKRNLERASTDKIQLQENIRSFVHDLLEQHIEPKLRRIP